MPRIVNIDAQRLRELCHQGLSDAELAREFNCSTSTIHNVRVQYGLPCNQPVGRNKVYPRVNLDDYSEAQRALLRRFFGDLVSCYRQRKPGDRVDMTGFFQEWRGGRYVPRLEGGEASEQVCQGVS
jgi:hypothetical protein